MKKAIGIIILGLLLNGCATTSSQVEKGNIKIGMNKEDFCVAAFAINPKKWACSSSSYLSSNPEGLYYPETKMEIMHDSYKEHFFVFQDVNIPFNYATWDDGDGRLFKIFTNFEKAKDFASSRKFEIGKDKAEIAKNACKMSGLNEGTEEFADCTLNKIVELSQ